MKTVDVMGLVRRRVVSSSLYSLRGLRACFIHEEAFRVEVVLATVLIPTGIIIGSTGVEKVLLVGSCLLVMIVELLNSAIETTVDRIGMETSELSGRAKDMGSAAVLLSMLVVLTTWGLLLFEMSRGQI